MCIRSMDAHAHNLLVPIFWLLWAYDLQQSKQIAPVQKVQFQPGPFAQLPPAVEQQSFAAFMIAQPQATENVVDPKTISLPLRRTRHQSQLDPKQVGGFSLLSHNASATAITNRLTGSQFRLWHYLMMVDQFADQTSSGKRIYHNIPSPADIGIAIGASSRTVEKDMRRLEKLGLYAKRITEWQGYNLTVEKAKHAAEAMKKAKAERTTENPAKSSRSLKPLQDKGGYLAAIPAKQPESRLNNRNHITESQNQQGLQAPVILPHIFTELFTSTTEAAVADEILKGDLWDEQLSAEENQGSQNEVVELDKLKHSTEMLGEETQGKEEINGEAAKPTVEGKCSASQLETLKKLGLVLSHGFKTQLDKVSSGAIDKAIACFEEDKTTWTAGEMTNPTGYFIKVLRQVRDGRQPQPMQQSETSERSRRIKADWELWHYEWQCYPARRESISQKAKEAYPSGEIVVDPNEGPTIKRL